MQAPQTFIIQSKSEELKPIREKLRRFLEAAGFKEKTLESLLVALGEAVTNCIRHSYKNEAGHEIHVAAEETADKVIFKIRDFGEKINLAGLKQPTLPPQQSGGLGVYFMQTIMDEMQYNTAHTQGNELILAKYKKEGKKG